MIRHDAMASVFITLTLSASAPPQPTRIAIIGGGLAGLGTAVHLLSEAQTPLEALHIFDAAEPGKGGASAVAAGLLHPFTPRSREIWKGKDGYAASAALLKRVEDLVGPVSSKSGLLRLAMSEKQAEELQHAVTSSESVSGDEAELGGSSLEQHWLTQQQACERAGSDVGGIGGVFAASALSIDVPQYVQGLWALCQSLGDGSSKSAEPVAQWHMGEVSSLASLLTSDQYDAVIVALGSRATALAGCEALPIRPCRGQNLVFSNEGGLEVPVISGKYLVPIVGEQGQPRLLGGATFEYDAIDIIHRPPEQAEAEEELVIALSALHPALSGERVVGCQAGVRALPPRSHFGYVPLAGRLGRSADGPSTLPPPAAAPAAAVDDASVREVKPSAPLRASADCWMVGALGSRGLIHHALLGKATALAVLHRDETILPEHTRRVQEALDSCDCSRTDLDQSGQRS